MSPELITAIKERIEKSLTKESIKDEVLRMGHSEEVFEAAYTLAFHDVKEGIIETAHTIPSPVIVLPKVMDLLKRSFTFTNQRFDLVVYIAIPLLASMVFMEVGDHFAENLAISVSAYSAATLALFVYFITFTSCLYQIAHARAGQTLYKESLTFVRRNLIAFVFTFILAACLLWGGMLFFFIPAIIISTYIYFTPLVLLYEGKKGMPAILASRTLVRGRWWAITLKLLGFLILASLPISILLSVYLGIVEAKQLNEWFVFGGDLVFEGVMAFVGIMHLFAVNQLYLALSASATPAVEKTEVKVRFWFLIALGVVAAAALIIVAILFPEKLESEIQEYNVPVVTEGTPVQSTIGESQAIAEQFFSERNSYEGVCEPLQANLSEATEIACNDTEGEWAVTAFDGLDTWCADETTNAKVIMRPLEGRTRCIEVPR